MTTTIPTAIVKPKYQRLPYDDRQLPPVVCIDREKSWFDNNSFNNNLVHAGKRIQLPHFERKSKKKFQTTATTTASTTTTITCDKEELTSGFGGEKDKFDSSAVIAIITPRKKEKLNDNMENCTEKIDEINELHDNSNSKNSNNNNNNNLTRPKVLQNTKNAKSSKEALGKYSF